MSINVADVAAELGVPVERVVRTLELNTIGHMTNLQTGERFVTEAVRTRLLSIYRHTGAVTPLQATPYGLREDFDADERRAARSDDRPSADEL